MEDASGANVTEPLMSEHKQSRGSGAMSDHGNSPIRKSDRGPLDALQCQRPDRFCMFWQERPPKRARVIVNLKEIELFVKLKFYVEEII